MFSFFRAPPCCGSQGAPLPLSKLCEEGPLPSTTNIRGGPFPVAKPLVPREGGRKQGDPLWEGKKRAFLWMGFPLDGIVPSPAFHSTIVPDHNWELGDFPFRWVSFIFCLNCPRSIRFFWGESNINFPWSILLVGIFERGPLWRPENSGDNKMWRNLWDREVSLRI